MRLSLSLCIVSSNHIFQFWAAHGQFLWVKFLADLITLLKFSQALIFMVQFSIKAARVVKQVLSLYSCLKANAEKRQKNKAKKWRAPLIICSYIMLRRQQTLKTVVILTIISHPSFIAFFPCWDDSNQRTRSSLLPSPGKTQSALPYIFSNSVKQCSKHFCFHLRLHEYSTSISCKLLINNKEVNKWINK